MLSLEEAMRKCEEASPNDEIVEKYKYQNKYYFMIRPKGLSKDIMADTAMNIVNAETGEVEFTNFFALVPDGTADKLRKL